MVEKLTFVLEGQCLLPSDCLDFVIVHRVQRCLILGSSMGWEMTRLHQVAVFSLANATMVAVATVTDLVKERFNESFHSDWLSWGCRYIVEGCLY